MSYPQLHIALFIVSSLIHFSAVSQNTTTYNYTGDVATYVVPSCILQLEVVVNGANGGGLSSIGGATVSGLIDVEEGQVIEIRVGNSGGCPYGGYNGGGDGGIANTTSNGGCGGGGASDIRIAPYGISDRIVVAAGGGGMGGGNTDATGGNGGCLNGGTGVSPFGLGGHGGTAFSGGNGGPPWISSGNTGGTGSVAQGGNGAIDPCYNLGPGGGGGGGYYGGGGGGSDCWGTWGLGIGGGGGGGGSSLAPDGFTCVEGNVNGSGSISITPMGYNIVEDIEACDDGSYLFPDGSLPTSSGIFEFMLQTELGCDSNLTIDLQLNQAYNLSFPAEICNGEIFYMPDGTGVGVQGDYISLLQTTDGCDSIVTIELVVQSLPNVTLGANDSYCPYAGNITLTPDPLGGTLSGDLLNGSELEHEGALPGNYEVSYSFTDGNGCTYTEVQEYVLTAPIEPSFNFNLLCNELQLENTTPDPMEGNLYLWQLDDESISVFAESLFFFEQTGTFDLGLTVTDIFGCNYSVTESVIFENTLDLTGFFVPNVITPNGDNYNDKLSLPSEVESCFDYTIDIYNRWGDLIYTMTQDTPGFSGRNQNGNEAPDGVYFYTLEIENQPCSEIPELTQWCTGKLSVFRD